MFRYPSFPLHPALSSGAMAIPADGPPQAGTVRDGRQMPLPWPSGQVPCRQLGSVICGGRARPARSAEKSNRVPEPSIVNDQWQEPPLWPIFAQSAVPPDEVWKAINAEHAEKREFTMMLVLQKHPQAPGAEWVVLRLRKPAG